MTPLILVDVDETLLQWRPKFTSWVSKLDLLPIDNLFNDNGGTDEFTSKIIRAFNQTYHIGNLIPYPHAVNVIENWRKAGLQINVFSSFSNDFHSQMLRVKNLEHVFGKVFSECKFFEYKSYKLVDDKISYIKDLINQGYDISLFDDNQYVVEAACKYIDPQNVYMYPHPYNEGFQPRLREMGGNVLNWKDFLDKEI